jgi:hypothetical protein
MPPPRPTALTPFAALLAVILLAGCQPAPRLADGCYYLASKPVMRLAGERGSLLVPGPVRDFGMVRKGAEVQVTPGFLFDGASDADFHSVAWDAPQRFTIRPGAKPALVVHLIGSGDSVLTLGPPC